MLDILMNLVEVMDCKVNFMNCIQFIYIHLFSKNGGK